MEFEFIADSIVTYELWACAWFSISTIRWRSQSSVVAIPWHMAHPLTRCWCLTHDFIFQRNSTFFSGCSHIVLTFEKRHDGDIPISNHSQRILEIRAKSRESTLHYLDSQPWNDAKVMEFTRYPVCHRSRCQDSLGHCFLLLGALSIFFHFKSDAKTYSGKPREDYGCTSTLRTA